MVGLSIRLVGFKLKREEEEAEKPRLHPSEHEPPNARRGSYTSDDTCKKTPNASGILILIALRKEGITRVARPNATLNVTLKAQEKAEEGRNGYA